MPLALDLAEALLADVRVLRRESNETLFGQAHGSPGEMQDIALNRVRPIFATLPGVSAPLTNNNALGRNSPNVSVNGARVTQNNYQINGVDGNDISLHVFADVGVPAPETVSEVTTCRLRCMTLRLRVPAEACR